MQCLKVDTELTGGTMKIQSLISTSLQVSGQESAKSTLFKPIPYKLLTRDTEKAGGMQDETRRDENAIARVRMCDACVLTDTH
jgi:hypothetical protein